MWIEIFRSGTHVDSAGKSESYDAEKLEHIAELYNRKVGESSSFEAPIVKGHPASDAPAYGWVERLARRGDKLVAKIKDMSEEIIEQTGKGMFKKVSMSIYPDYMLRHVGLLGAVPPAVKGLRNISFSEELEYKEYSGGDQTEETTPQPPPSQAGEQESSDMLKEMEELRSQCAVLEEDNRQMTESVANYNEQIKQMETDSRRKDFEEYVSSLVSDPKGAKITPAQCDSLIDLLESASARDTNAGSDFRESISQIDKIKSFINSLPIIPLSEQFGDTEFAESDIPEFDTDAYNVSQDRLELHRQARELQRGTPGMNYEEAVYFARKM
ncbi:MAG: hypothetical protein PF588_06665 [Candidatus Kapabacteria bacterium]|jgi:hypothetical protein|nr:hypothetical protein [Candidatus Kapabacteria bacterium]